jgi:hypothetical protein
MLFKSSNFAPAAIEVEPCKSTANPLASFASLVIAATRLRRYNPGDDVLN